MAGGEADRKHYEGHRERIRQRFLTLGADNLEDYEILELLLTTILPRQDVKPLAKSLLQHYGSFAAVMHADAEELQRIKGIGPATAVTLTIIAAAAVRMLRDTTRQAANLSSFESVIEYCRLAMGFEDREQFRILFLDRKNRLLADEVQQKGTVDHAPVYPREVARRALQHNATAVILVHNHPSGDPTPSRADIAMTKEIVAAAKAVGVTVHDHIVIARDGHASLRALGLM